MSVSSTSFTYRHDPDDIAELHGQGLTAPEIAERLGCAVRTVQRWRSAAGVAEPVPQRSDEFPARLVRARELLEDGASYVEVSRTLHMSPRTLRRHFPGMGWTALQGSQLGAFVARMNREMRRGDRGRAEFPWVPVEGGDGW